MYTPDLLVQQPRTIIPLLIFSNNIRGRRREVKVAEARKLTVMDRFTLEMVSGSAVAILMTLILALINGFTDTNVDAFWILGIWLIWSGSAWVLAYLGQGIPWSTKICVIMGALSPIIIILLVIIAYLPGNITRFKHRK